EEADAGAGTRRGTGPGAYALALAPRSTSLLAVLRKIVARTPALDGIRVDRGWDGGGTGFGLSGLEDHPGPAEQLIPVLTRAAEQGGWRDQLPGGVRLGTFTDFALRPLLDRLGRVLPAVPAFDGVLLDRAYYDENSALVLAGRAVGRTKRPDLSRPLREVL